jgi:hypothetical protein
VLDAAQDVDGEGVAFGAGAQPGGDLQQRGEGLVQGVAAGRVAFGADQLQPGLRGGVLGS